jgi:hydrogenase maturation protease
LNGSDKTEATTLIIGVGNSLRRDDGAGPAVAHRITSQLPPGVAVLEHSGEGASLMEAWQGFDWVVIVDASSSEATPGAIHRFDAHSQPLPSDLFHYSSHLFGVAEAIEMARTLGRLPPRLIVYAIEGAVFDYGEGLSEAVEGVVGQVADRILEELGGIE